MHFAQFSFIVEWRTDETTEFKNQLMAFNFVLDPVSKIKKKKEKKNSSKSVYVCCWIQIYINLIEICSFFFLIQFKISSDWNEIYLICGKKS